MDVEMVRLFEAIGLNTADKVRVFRPEASHQSVDGHFELGARGGRTSQRCPSRIALGEELFDDRMRALVHGLRKAANEEVAILFNEPLHVVRHPSGVVF